MGIKKVQLQFEFANCVHTKYYLSSLLFMLASDQWSQKYI